MSSNKVIYDGKVKSIMLNENSLTVIQYFKDKVTAFNKGKYQVFDGKGIITNYISALIMQRLEEAGVKTHYIKNIGKREQLVKKLKIIPLEVVIRNISAGSFCRRFNLKEGVTLTSPIVEFFYKNDDLSDPIVNENYILYSSWLSSEEIQDVKNTALKINKILLKLFLSVDIYLVDFKLEFGRLIDDSTQIILADEISPDNCRLWDRRTYEKLDKDVFRLNLGDLNKAYLEVAKRLSVELV